MKVITVLAGAALVALAVGCAGTSAHTPAYVYFQHDTPQRGILRAAYDDITDTSDDRDHAFDPYAKYVRSEDPQHTAYTQWVPAP